MTEVRDGWLESEAADARIRWWLHGEGEDTLVILHGGPGAGTAYLEPLRALADDGLQVLLYDQLGSGQSDRPDDPTLWTLERSVAEVEHVRTALSLGPVHVLGQSFGGFLALEYTLAHPGDGAQPGPLQHRGERARGRAPHEPAAGRPRPGALRDPAPS